MTDWSKECGVATEPDIDRFIVLVGGERIDASFPNADFENADYVFHDRKIIIELKILETEFESTVPFLKKEESLHQEVAKKFGAGPILRGERTFRKFYASRKREMYREPLGRIVKKANRQIRETKKALSLKEYRGVLWLVNDNFRQVRTDTAISLLCSCLTSANSQVRGLIYITNHYVDIAGSDFANLPWVPAYADGEADDLPDFVNWLGSEWFKFCEAEIGKFDDRRTLDDVDFLIGARPITSS